MWLIKREQDMNDAEKKQVVFRIGEETKPVILNKQNYGQSLFAEQIETGLSLIYEAAEKCKHNGDRGDYHYRFSDVFDNNIITFIGERGSGKSSCMYSVANVLAENKEKASEFAFLDTLDPSFFDDNHNILQLIIGKMYGQFRKEMDKLAGKEDYLIHEVVKQFQEVKGHLRFLEDKPEYVEDNELEELSQLSAGVDLRSSLLRLIDTYLQLLKAQMLIVIIDDIDLNTEQAYDMAEQIRKYLILPNVVILLAAKLDQFTDVVRLKLTKQYTSLLAKERMGDDAITEMADRYVKKLLPLENRIYMPQNEAYIERPLRIEWGDEKNCNTYKSIKMAVPELIFQKCRYLFYNTRGTTSLIVPRNLRDLRLLVSMLYRMPDYTDSNKNIFKKYFFNDWLNALSSTSKTIAQRLLAVDEPTQLNKSVINELKNQYKLSGDSTNEEIEGWPVILQDNTMNYNLSIGDAFAVMDYVRRVNADADTQRLIFFIKSLYSIRLYEYYDQQTDYIDTHDQEADPEEEKKKEELPNRRDDFLENVSSYRKLIGGSFFNIGGSTLLPPERNDDDAFDGVSRETIIINKKSLQDKIKEIKEAAATISDKTSDELKLLTDDLKAVEFMMLTISHHYLRKDVGGVEQKNRSYRERMDAYYDRPLAEVQNVKFDVTTPFFTLLDVRHSYDRFDNEIFDIAKKWNYRRPEGALEGLEEYFKSLYVEMLEASDKGLDRKPEHDLLSRAGIRNAEVADDLFEYLKSFRDKYRPGTRGLIGILANFYSHISEYEIATYDKEESAAVDDDERYYKIKYVPFECIAKYLEKTDNELLTKTFNVTKTKRETRRIEGGHVVSVVPEFEYIDHAMTRDEIWQQLVQHVPGIENGDYHDKLFHQTFKKGDVSYSKERIVGSLQNLSQKSTWVILRGVVEPAPAQPAIEEPAQVVEEPSEQA